MAGTIRKSGLRQASLSKIKDGLAHFLRETEKHGIVIPRHGKPAGVLIRFESEDDWFDYHLENDPRFRCWTEKGTGGAARQARSMLASCGRYTGGMQISVNSSRESL